MTIITPQAKAIFDAGNEYWSEDRKEYLLIDAVDFGKDAYFLAGPFLEKFGLVYIRFEHKALPFKKLRQYSVENMYESTCWMPHQVKVKVEAAFGSATEFYFKRKPAFKSISGLDVAAGKFDLRKWEKSDNLCQLFWNTHKGRAKVDAVLDGMDKYWWDEHVRSYAEKFEAEDLKTLPCAERPYSVILQGSDDASWTRTFATLKEAELLLEDLKKYGQSVVSEQMTFTN